MPSNPLAIVTCGPAHEPIDAVRRITNASTGELGVFLCRALREKGFDLICLCGEMASQRPADVPIISFSTNQSVLESFKELPRPPRVIFHAAALCDFVVAGIEGAAPAQKIRSDVPDLRLTLRSAPKVLPELPRLFPEALIVGWKYELDGDRETALEHGRKQIAKAGTAACVVNGTAYGPGFAFLEKGVTSIVPLSDKETLSAFLAAWAAEKV